MKLLFFSLIFLFTFSACQSLQVPSVSPNDEVIHFKKTLYASVNGVVINGMGVVEIADKYKITLKTKGGNIDKIIVMSCHREMMLDGPEKGWFKNPRVYEFEFIPSKEIESKNGCKLDFSVLSKDEGRYSFGLIDFMDLNPFVGNSVFCNGTVTKAKGVSVCQSREGLKQRLEFDSVVKSGVQDGCPKLESIDGKVFEYFSPLGECTYYFMTKDGGLHRHTSFGYESVLLD